MPTKRGELFSLRVAADEFETVYPTADIVFDLRSLICGFAESCKDYSVALLQSQKMSYQKCSIDIFVDLQPFGCNFKGGTFLLPNWGGARKDVNGNGPFR